MRFRFFDTSMRLSFVLLLASSVACSGGPAGHEPPDPLTYEYQEPLSNGDTWQTAHAADVGVDVSRIESMMNAIPGPRFDLIDAIAVARNGRIVLDETIRTSVDSEDSRVGNTDPRMHAQFSAIKSVTALAVGIAIDRGYMTGVDTPFLDFFPYSSYANWDERKRDMTLGHVLAMHAGLAWNEWNPPYSSPENQLSRFYDREYDYAKALLDLPLAADPGTEFAYNTVATIALAQAIENSAPLSFVDFGLNELVLPLGITQVEFLTTPTGLPNAGGGFYFKTRDMAKFGQLVLDGGTWNAERIVPSHWIDLILENRTAIGWSEPEAWPWQLDGYGYQWWLGHYEQGDEVLDTWAMWGFGGQWVVVIPDRQLVVAINSHGYDDDDEALRQVHTLISEYLLPSTSG